jgi:RND family efflux transporter MFP subunit
MNREEKTERNSTIAGSLKPEKYNPAGAASRKRSLLIAAALIVVFAIAVGIRLWRGANRSGIAGRPVPAPDFDLTSASQGGAGASPRAGDLLITIPPDKLENARLKIEAATIQQSASTVDGGLRTTGTVEPNAYKVVPVLPIAGGIVREVKAELGDKVMRGQRLATIFSTELADAQMAYLSMQAEIERHHQHYHRTEQLVEIGAVSREEFEAAAAEYKIEQARLGAMRQKLILLGMTEKQIEALRDHNQMNSLIAVESPVAGTLLDRLVNPGEVVMQNKELFRVADLSTVWVIGQIYEKDFAEVRAGSQALITAPAYPGRSFSGRVSYIDPRVEPQMRTAQYRIEVGNPGEILKLGMFVDVGFGAAASPAASRSAVGVPRSAVQTIGSKQVVFAVTDQPGVFAQREVSAGPESNGILPIFAGLEAGDRVVTDGSFLLRAESLKQNPSQLAASPATAPTQTSAQKPAPVQPPQSQESGKGIQSITITLGERGYQPESLNLRQGVPARVTFVRKVEATCGNELLIQDYGIKRELPLNQPVVVEFTPAKSGELKFSCGMDMLRGKIIVK